MILLSAVSSKSKDRDKQLLIENQDLCISANVFHLFNNLNTSSSFSDLLYTEIKF